MVSKSDITVIVPLHKWDEEVNTMFTEAIKSIPAQVNLLVVTTEDSGFSFEFDVVEGATCEVIKSNDGSSFQHLVNIGVNNVKTEWFSILEFDDEYSAFWFDEFIKYQEYNQQYDIFLPLNDLYSSEEGGEDYVGYGNEAPLSPSFSEEIGVIDEKSLEDYFNFYMTGSIIRTQTWKELGGLKEGIKLTFWYEFMLRAVHKGEKIYVVPKVGYAHLLGRKGSLMDEYRQTIDEKESNFWFNEAKKQSYFKEDKKVTYNPTKKVPLKEEDEEVEKED
jgi:hypothetical protein